MEKKRYVPPKKKPCPFCKASMKDIDYKDVELLKKFISPETGKIEPVSYTHLTLPTKA